MSIPYISLLANIEFGGFNFISQSLLTHVAHALFWFTDTRRQPTRKCGTAAWGGAKWSERASVALSATNAFRIDRSCLLNSLRRNWNLSYWMMLSTGSRCCNRRPKVAKLVDSLYHHVSAAPGLPYTNMKYKLRYRRLTNVNLLSNNGKSSSQLFQQIYISQTNCPSLNVNKPVTEQY